MARAAVAIGIGKTTGFKDLPGAAAGAEAFATWAEAHGYRATRFISSDAANPVTALALQTHLSPAFLSNCDQLVIFFSGHGMAPFAGRDFWILSGGAEQPGNVVDLSASVDQAALHRVPHVVFLSDACRTPERPGVANALIGGTAALFPTPQPADFNNAQVDVLFGTRPGEITQEPVDRTAGVPTTFYTAAILEALGGAAGRLDAARGLKVVSAGDLRDYVKKRVPVIARDHRAKTQVPTATIGSDADRAIVELPAEATAPVRIRVVGPPRSKSKRATIELLRMDPVSRAIAAVAATAPGPELKAEVAAGAWYGVRVSLADFRQEPAAPRPFEPLDAPWQADVRLVSVAPGLAPAMPAPGAPAAEDELASLIVTYVVDDTGGRHATAPADGLFTVVSEDIATGRVASEGQSLSAGARPTAVASLRPDPALVARLAAMGEYRFRDHFETQTGLSVSEGRVYSVYTPVPHWGVFRDTIVPEPRPWNVRYPDNAAPAAAVLTIGRGRHAAVAILPGFIGDIALDRNGVEHLSYFPDPKNNRYSRPADRVIAERRQLMGLAEAAARRGHLRELATEGARFQELLLGDYIDPAFAVLYGAALMADHRLGELMQLVDTLRGNGQPVPFDLPLMLSADPRNPGLDVFPAYPLLTANWRFFASWLDFVHPAIREAYDRLAPSLWTTIVGDAGRAVGRAIRKGELEWSTLSSSTAATSNARIP